MNIQCIKTHKPKQKGKVKRNRRKNQERFHYNKVFYKFEDLRNNYLYITLFIEKKSRNSIYGVESGMIFLNYLFDNYPIRKAYCTVYKYNKMSFKFLQNAGFEIEGVLKEHRYFDGKYHDMMIFSFYREKLDELNKRLKYSKK